MNGPIGVAGLAAVILLAVPSGAAADGLPVGGVDAGRAGVATAAQPDRYVTLRAGRDTVVARVRRAGGHVRASRRLRGTFTVPAVALDGSASGLSGDGRTLALIRPRRRFPQARTTLAVLDTAPLRLRRVVSLHGDFSFDALSPDGRVLYLIHYLAPRDPTRYEVRAYDVPGGRLLPEPIVDPREADERMRGLPVTRLASPDGRWHYTLYDGAGGHPFIHALDTTGRTAACIDLHGLSGRRDIYDLRLALRGPRGLAVLAGAEPLALVDRTTFGVRRPEAPEAPANEEAPWGLVALALLPAVAAGAAVAGRRRLGGRRRGEGGEEDEAARHPGDLRAGERGTSRDVSLV